MTPARIFCPTCRQDLRHLDAPGACPECGRAVDPGDPTTYETALGLRARHSAGLAGLLVHFVLFATAFGVRAAQPLTDVHPVRIRIVGCTAVLLLAAVLLWLRNRRRIGMLDRPRRCWLTVACWLAPVVPGITALLL